METLGAEVIISTDSHIARIRSLRERLPSLRRRPGRRGAVYGMSAASARRLRRLLSFIKYTPAMSFLTLTYPAAVTIGKVKRDIDALGKRLRRKFPAAWGVWKIELQQRGVWHIHVLLVNVPFWSWRDIVKTWGEISGQDAQRATNIKQVRSLRQLRVYLAKYIAKQSRAVDAESGEILDEHTGRCWGILNRSAAVFIIYTAYLPRRAYYSLIRAVRRLRYNVQFRDFWVYRASFVARWTEYYGVAHSIEKLTYAQLRASF